MLNLYSARDNIDKEKFIYKNVENISDETFVIVPDQYTLVAEQQALKYTGKSCLYDIEIMSMNRLGERLLIEKGKENLPLLKKQGRRLLLYRIISAGREELSIFGKTADKAAFVDMVDDFISSLKQQNCSAEDMEKLVAACGQNEILHSKLKELAMIVNSYQREIAGRYTDNEDRISMYTDAMSSSQMVKNKNIWIYGFDSITPKFTAAIVSLAICARQVNFVVNENDFPLCEMMTERLISEAKQAGVSVSHNKIPETYLLRKNAAIAEIERELFAEESPRKQKYQTENTALTIVECANPYYEAESAAAYIHELIRDESYRMSDIVVICNDEQARHPIIKRTFEEYGLSVFSDARHGISDSQAVAFITSQLGFIVYGGRTGDMLMMLKSGLTDFGKEDIWRLENYVRSYGIKGNMWKQAFKYGAFEYSEDEFLRIENMRNIIMTSLSKLEKLASESDSAAEFAEGYIDYLNSEWKFKDKLAMICREQIESGYIEAAELTAQTYDAAMDMFSQISEILGNEKLILSEFMELCSEGFANMDIGIIPPVQDGITMGTMIRTRPAPVKAVIILGANEGVLPMEPATEGLFSVEEKAYFDEEGFPLGSLEEIKLIEESVAMYRLMSKPSDKLFISYSMTDGSGKELRPALFIDSVKKLFPDLEIKKDIVSEGFTMKLVNDRREAMRHFINHIKERPCEEYKDKEHSGALAKTLGAWLVKNEPDHMNAILAAANADNRAKPLSKESAVRLFAKENGDFVLSASRLEKYYRCPFEHFVTYGLKPIELREYKGGSREIGDIYHECIMRVTKTLMEREIRHVKSEYDTACNKPADNTAGINAGKTEFAGISADHSQSDDIHAMVQDTVNVIASEYRGGLFLSAGREKYRLDRICNICEEALLAISEQIRSGQIETAFFEERFGRGCRFEPIEYTLRGEKVYIEGKIDRVDILAGGDIRIVDYKTGKDKPDIEQMRSGYKMQLMIYMQGVSESELAPAGVFYFNISDDDIRADGMSDAKLGKEIEKFEDERFRMRGIYIDEPGILDKLAPDSIHSSSIRLDREAFGCLENDVRKSMEIISDGIVSGKIDISPTKLIKDNTDTECRYCKYRAICKFDLSYSGNSYRMI